MSTSKAGLVSSEALQSFEAFREYLDTRPGGGGLETRLDAALSQALEGGGAEGGGAEGGGAEGGGEGGGGAEGEQVQRKSVRCRGNAEFMEIRAKFEWGVHAISRQLSFDNRRRRRLRSLRSREVGDGSPSHGAAPTPVASSPLGDYCPLRAPPNTPCNAPGQEQPGAAREPCSVPGERGESAGSGSGSAGGAAARRRWGMDDVLDAQKRWLKVQQRLMQSPVSPFSP